MSDWIICLPDELHPTTVSVKIIAHIRKNSSGEVRKYETDSLWDTDNNEPNIFIWEEGNYSCDCNRRLFFARVKNEEEDWVSQCSRDGYSVNLQNPKNGEFFYKEFE